MRRSKRATLTTTRSCVPSLIGFALVAGGNAELENPALDRDQLGLRFDAHSHRRGGEVADVELHAERLMSLGQEMLDRRERGRLEQVDDDRGREHRHFAAADVRGGVLGGDQQAGRAPQPVRVASR